MGDFPRIPCLVIGCRRGTTKFAPGAEVICGKCWRSVPTALRTKHREAVKVCERLYDQLDALAATRTPAGLLDDELARWDEADAFREAAWSACTAAAIEAAVGLA